MGEQGTSDTGIGHIRVNENDWTDTSASRHPHAALRRFWRIMQG